jgi:hypothetical protein
MLNKKIVKINKIYEVLIYRNNKLINFMGFSNIKDAKNYIEENKK